MRSIRAGLAVMGAACLLLAGNVFAQVAHRAYLDLDNNPATGCGVATAAGPVSGIEARLTATASGQPPMVTAVTRENCSGGSFGATVSQPAGYPVGVNIGVGGSDVVEFSTSLAGLGTGGPARIVFVSQTATGADIVEAAGVFLPGQAAVPTQPAIIPATGLLTLVLLAALVVWLVRKHPGFGSSVALLLLFGAGVVWAANFVTDGQIGDWAGVSPRAADANNDSTSGEMTIEIVAVFAETEGGNLFLRVDIRDAQNQVPTANTPAAVTLNEDGTATITLTGTDPEGAPLTFAIGTAPTRGTLGPITPVNGTTATVLYTATANQNGADSFTFTANDGSSTSAAATVSLTITPINDSPVVTGQTFLIPENASNGTVVGTVTAADPDTGQALTWSITAGNTGGAFAINPASGQITVADTADVIPGNAPFSLTVTATDNGTPVPLAGSATVTVNVTGVNDEPIFTAGPNQTSVEDDPAVTVISWATAIVAGPADEAGQTLTFTVTNDNNALFSVQPGISSTGTLTYTLAPHANGSATVSVFLRDNGGTANGGDDTSPTVTFTITVTPVNDAPSFTVGPNQIALQTDGPLSISPWATAISSGPTNESAQTVTFAVTNNDMPVLFTAGPAISPAGVLTFDPAPGQVGVATITVRVSDSGGTANGGVDTSATQTFTITITDVNDAPSFTVPAAAPSVAEDVGPVTETGFATALNDNDPGTQTLTFNITGNTNTALFAAGPAISGTTGDLTYTPTVNANGTATITVTLSDDGGTANGGVDTSAAQTFTITVTAVNDTPSFALPASPNQTVPQNSPTQTVNGFASAISRGPADESAQTLTFAVSVTSGAALFSVAPDIDEATGNLTYTPAAGQVGTATVSVTLADNGGGADTTTAQTFTITLLDINDPPTFTTPANAPTVNEDAGAVTEAGFITAIDDGDAAVQAVSFNVVGNSNPSLFLVAPAVSSTGTLTYTPALNANGTANIVIEAMDDGGTALGGDDTSATQSFVITVTPVNDAPNFTVGTNQTALQTDGPQTVNPWATAISPGPADEGAQTVSFAVTNNDMPALFTAGPAISPAGVLTFDPAPGQVGTATITVQASDTGGTANGGVDTSAAQTFTITITDVNDAPSFTVPAAAAAVNEDAGPVTEAGFATAINDNDPGTQVLTFNVTGNTNAALFAAGPAISGTTGNLTYTPAANANGTATITVTLSDDGGTANGGVDTSAAQTFTITVNAINDAPTFTMPATAPAVDENAGAQTVTGFTSAMSTGPADETGQTLTGFTVNVTGTTGSLAFGAAPAIDVSTGNLTYTASANTSGTATVSVTLSDNGSNVAPNSNTSAALTFTITVNGINSEPTFNALSNPGASNEDAGAQTVNGFATGMNPGAGEAGQTLTFFVSQTGGSLAFSASPIINATTGNLTYTAAANANGTATFDVFLMDDGGTANGGDDTSATQSFTITVNPVNDVPSFTAGPNQTVLEGAGAQSVDPWATALSAGPADESGQTLTFAITGNTNPALFTSGPAVSATGALSYTPAANVSGTATISVRASDSGGTANGGVDTSASQDFTITVLDVNDEPTFTVGANQAVNEDAGAQTVNAFLPAFDDGDPGVTQVLTFNVSNDNNALFSVQPAISATGVLTYTPAANAFGSTVVTVFVQDDGGTANGGDDTSPSQTFTVTVNSVNDEPSFTKGPDQTVLEDSGPATADPWATGLSAGPANEASQTLNLAVTGNTNAALFTAGPAISSTGVLTFTPAANAAGSATITLSISDNGGTANGGDDTSATQTFVITVTSVNDAPSFTKGADQTVLEDAAAQTINGWATAPNDGDAEAVQTLSFVVSNNNSTLFTAGGQPVVSGTGVLTYTPALNAFGTATVTIQIQDNGGTANGGVDISPTQTFVITVNPVNDPPTATVKTHTSHSAIGLTINAATHTGELKEGAGDVDTHDPFAELTVQLVGGSVSPANATVTLISAADGSFYFEPPGGTVGTGSASFQFQVCDNGDVGLGVAPACSTATTVSFNLTGYNGNADGLWFVDDTDAAGCGASCNGARTKPYPSLAAFNAAAGGRGTGDRIFLFAGTYAAGAGHTFNASEHLIGQGTTGGTFDAIVGVTVPGNGTLDTRPTLNPTPADETDLPVVRGTITANVANVVLRGVSISTTGATGFSANATGTGLTVSDTRVASTVAAVSAAGSTAAGAGVNFLGVSSSGGANGIVVADLGGAWDFSTSATPGTLTGNTVAAFSMSNTAAIAPTLDYDGDITPAVNARAVDIGGAGANTGLRGGTLAFGGSLTTTSNAANANAGGLRVRNSTGGTLTFEGASQNLSANANIGVELATNPGAIINFTGGNLDVATTSGTAFTASGGGTLTVTGAGNSLSTENDGSPAGGMLLGLNGVTSAATGITFASATGHGGSATAHGINITNLGGTGGATINGGTLTNYQQKGVLLFGSSNIVIAGMNLTGNGTVNATPSGTCGDAANGSNTNANCNANMSMQNVTSVNLSNMVITGSAQQGLNGHTVADLVLANLEVANNGNEVFEDGIQLVNLTTTAQRTWTGLNLHDNASRQLEVQNSSGSHNILITSPQITNTVFPSAGVGQQGVLWSARSTGNVTVRINNGTFARNRGAAFFTDVADAASSNVMIDGGTMIDNGLHFQAGMGGTTGTGNLTYALMNLSQATVNPANTNVGPIGILKGGNTTGTMTGTISNNVFGSPGVPFSGSPCISCVIVAATNGAADSGLHRLTISGNTFNQSGHQAIDIAGGGNGTDTDGSQFQVNITGNTIQNPADPISGSNPLGDPALVVNIGTGTGDTTQACAHIQGNTITGSWAAASGGGHIRVRNRQVGTGLRLPGFTGPFNDVNAAATFISGQNGGVPATGQLTNGAVFSGGNPIPCF